MTNLRQLCSAPDALATLPAIGSPLFERALEVCPLAMCLVDMRQVDQPLVFVNLAFELLTGYGRAEVLGRNCRLLQAAPMATAARESIARALRAGERLTVMLRNRRKDGSDFLNELMLQPLRDHAGVVSHFVGVQSDVSEREHRRLQLAAIGAPGKAEASRAMLDDRLEQALARARSVGTRCALLLIELDVGAGPQAGVAPPQIQELGRVIGEVLLDTASSLCRINDTRIALLIEPAPESAVLSDLARQLMAAMGELLAQDGGDAGCRLGIAVGPADGDTAQELLLASARGLERARRRAEGGDIAFFSPAQDARLLQVRQLETELARALEHRQFSLVYQPIVHLDTARIAGFEVLLRWHHPERGAIAPDDFIPVAESSGMMPAIGNWVIEQSLGQLAKFDRLGGPPPRLFVNVSASQFERPGFVDGLCAQMRRHGIQAGRLELELTERTVIDQSPATLQTLRALRQGGIAMAIDDFGTGFSNLHSLTLLPLDTLKIDRCFTQVVTQTGTGAAVSRLINELGRAMSLNVVVEGIETAGQLNHFRALGCRFGQGYLFSHPLSADAACALLQARQPLYEAAPADDAQHLLLLDDEDNILSSLRRLLRRDGYRVHTTSSPQAAFEILATQPVGVVVSDQRMPQMNGTEFLRQVKSLHPHTVRMVLSGYSESSAVQGAVNEGAIWKFLSKPWSDDDLREQIRLAFAEHAQLREAARQRAESVLERGKLQREVSQRDQQLALEVNALEAARDTLSLLPIPVLAIDAGQMVVMSNHEADRLFGAGASVMGEFLSALWPADALQALDEQQPMDLALDGRSYALHVRALGSGAAPNGQLLSLVPRRST